MRTKKPRDSIRICFRIKSLFNSWLWKRRTTVLCSKVHDETFRSPNTHERYRVEKERGRERKRECEKLVLESLIFIGYFIFILLVIYFILVLSSFKLNFFASNDFSLNYIYMINEVFHWKLANCVAVSSDSCVWNYSFFFFFSK